MRAWAIKGPDGKIISIAHYAVTAWLSAFGNGVRTTQKEADGYRCVEGEFIEREPADRAGVECASPDQRLNEGQHSGSPLPMNLGERTIEENAAEAIAACQTGIDDYARQYSSSQPAQEPTEIARLRAGLQWYADHHHYDLEGWEDCSGESANWLFPPTEHSWMVDNGGIARAILDGHEINPDPDADEVTRRPVAAERAT